MSPAESEEGSRRLFVAVSLPEDVRVALHAAVREAVAPLLAPRAVTWVREPNLHLTVRFLGDRPVALVDPLVRVLGAAMATVPRHELRIGGLGAFPGDRRARVLWIGVEANVALALLYQKVDDACAQLGIEREARDFHPHVTVGRVRTGASVRADRLQQGAAALTTSRWTMPVETVDLMSSELAPGGARYRRLAAVPLSPTAEPR